MPEIKPEELAQVIEAMERLGSMGAFDQPRAVGQHDTELLCRIEYARECAAILRKLQEAPYGVLRASTNTLHRNHPYGQFDPLCEGCQRDRASRAQAPTAINEAAQGVPQGWQPIETAPKDCEIVGAAWQTPDNNYPPELSVQTTIFHRGEWVYPSGVSWTPTHWVPRLAAPGAASPVQVCPYIRSSDEGTSYCALAEKSNSNTDTVHLTKSAGKASTGGKGGA